MTQEKILGLEPGPELDRLLAERLMGWRVERKAIFGYSVWEDKAGRERASEDSAGDLDWSPSSDISAAWEIVQAMEDRGWQLLMFSSKGAKGEEGKNGLRFSSGKGSSITSIISSRLPLLLWLSLVRLFLALHEEEADGQGGETWL